MTASARELAFEGSTPDKTYCKCEHFTGEFVACKNCGCRRFGNQTLDALFSVLNAVGNLRWNAVSDDGDVILPGEDFRRLRAAAKSARGRMRAEDEARTSEASP